MKKFKDLILFKPNQLIEITGAPLTAQGLLTYDFILHRLQQEKTDNLILSLNEITKAIGIEGNYDEIYLYLDSLQRIRIESKDVKGKLWGAFNLLSEYKKCEDGVFVAVPPTISKALKTQDDNKDSLYYTTIKLLEKRVFRCVYSLIFYDLFKKYEKVNIPILGLDEIREFTGTINKYPEYKAFKVHVLKKAVEELNTFEKKYEYDFEEIKISRRVHKIKFIKTEKKILDLLDNELSEKLVKAIEKARKNRFVDLVYSQKAMDKIIKKYEEVDVIKGLNELYKYNSEIKNFSKILISKIDDIKNSKIELIKTKVRIKV
ncbi:hypothetical protein, partial [Cetobacterium sp.]|uniref:hypothetical protein n=1 Tax=Cetobacterium sp. TaxID=2071632 RepID=UPI003F34ED3C